MRKLLLAVPLLLGGCNAIPGYAEYNAAGKALALEGIQEYKNFHDDERKALILALCDTSIGSVGRESDPIVREFLLRNPQCPVMTVRGLTGGFGSASYMGP